MLTPASAFSQSLRFRTSPLMNSTSRERCFGMPSGWTRGWSESITRTDQPSRRYLSARWEPINPAPPVIRIFTGKMFLCVKRYYDEQNSYHHRPGDFGVSVDPENAI